VSEDLTKCRNLERLITYDDIAELMEKIGEFIDYAQEAKYTPGEVICALMNGIKYVLHEPLAGIPQVQDMFDQIVRSVKSERLS